MRLRKDRVLEEPLLSPPSIPTTAPPFTRFFLLASLDAAAGMGVLLVYFLFGLDLVSDETDNLFAWHGRELVFGYAPGVCTGFLLTALPRWTGRTPSRTSENVLLALWLLGRAAVLLPPAFAPLIATPLIGLAAVVSFHVLAARDWRDLKVIVLLCLSALGGLLATLPAGADTARFGLRLGIAASMGLVMIVGGRIASSVTASLIGLRGKSPPVEVSPVVEAFAAGGAVAGLFVWLFFPTGLPMTLAGLLAAATQSLRLAQWRGWSVVSAPAVFLLHVAYAFVPVGFALFSVNASWPDLVPESAALHAWTVGGLGMMTLGVMGSMIRPRIGRSFATSPAGLAVFAFIVLAAVARVAAAFPDAPTLSLAFAAACWITAFALFVFDFRMPLVMRGEPDASFSRPPRSAIPPSPDSAGHDAAAPS